MNMNVQTQVVGPIGSNCHFAIAADRQVLVVDPGADAERLARFIAGRQLRVAAYLLTHGHMDHISALADLSQRHPAPIAMHGADAAWAFGERNQMPPWFGVPEAPAAIDRVLQDGQTWTDAGFTYRVLETPGHTPGSVCFLFSDAGVAFTGDTLFAGSVGRTDLPGGNTEQLRSALARLSDLPPRTRLYAGHGPPTTLAAELLSNPFLRDWRAPADE